MRRTALGVEPDEAARDVLVVEELPAVLVLEGVGDDVADLLERGVDAEQLGEGVGLGAVVAGVVLAGSEVAGRGRHVGGAEVRDERVGDDVDHGARARPERRRQ